MFYTRILLLFLVKVFCDIDRLHGWNYINLHCRDNDNSPVKWWIIYKPPKGSSKSGLSSGRNFSYIVSDNADRWLPSDILITGSSMLKHTLSPMYRPTYSDHLARITYQSKPTKGVRYGSSANGLMLADELGGVWISHTVPGLPDLEKDREVFPENELKNGHLILCVSSNFITLNDITKLLRQVDPTVLNVKVPNTVQKWLPDWMIVGEPFETPTNIKDVKFPSTMKMVVGDNLQAQLMARRPGENRCLYKNFARDRHIILDVYGHDRHSPPECEKNYSLRNIDSIALRYPDKVYRINNMTDRASFAVSSRKSLHRTGNTTNECWVCLGSSESEDLTGKGGLVLCINDYKIWKNFNTLKTKEPKC